LISLIIYLITVAATLYSANFQDFDLYQDKFTQEEVEHKIKTYLEKDERIGAFYRLTPEALYIGDLARNQTDYILRLATTPQSSPVQNKKTLKGSKIAIDPGHFGGKFAKLEERFIEGPNKTVLFDEGTLTYLTALLLKSLLEAEGAHVFISRPGIEKGATGDNFFAWLEKHPNHWNSKHSLTKLFRTEYNRADLLTRAEKINAFSPDLTIIIHYNAHLSEQEKYDKEYLTQSNYNLVFIPGAFCANELNRPEDRYEFLRMIVTTDIERSSLLSEQIATQFVNHLKIPLISDESPSYITNTCLFQQTGVYARNLALTRLIRGPLCYGETLIQNNAEEMQKLATCELTVAGRPCSVRVREVAQAYFDGIKSYFETP
jgi:N-acetylmuramoyl-L-alanine amidase